MVEEAYVSFEVAKLLKKKRFDIPVWTRYEDSDEVIFGNKNNWNSSPMEQTSAPTQQMAMRWLREEKLINISIVCDSSLYKGYLCRINGMTITELSCFSSYEEAVEASIKYCLENFSLNIYDYY